MMSTDSSDHHPHHRVWMVIVFAMLGLHVQAKADSEIVRITSVNGEYQANHVMSLDVHPGDVISLSADVLTQGENTDGYAPENRPVEEFTWSATDQTVDGNNDACDASQEDNCLQKSNFEVTDYGVNFYVPYQMGEEITVRVSHHSTDSDADSESDTLVLHNSQYSPDYEPPSTVVTDPDDYNYPQFDPDHALAGQGRWVVIDGERYWVPYAYDSGWVPYRNGYWTWVDGDGWTWVSYDPWGWYTDHYGIWRHHNVYGWIWVPFDDYDYRPAPVTWYYDDDGYVGWYPYYDDYRRGYRHGYEDGFDDGFWAGYHAGHYYVDDDRYFPGFSCVRYEHFNRRNIVEIVLDRDEARDIFRNTYKANRYGKHPGDHDLDRSHEWMEHRAGHLNNTEKESRHFGDKDFHTPRKLNPVPPKYRQVPGAKDRFGKPIPVGSIVEHGSQGGARIIPPTSNSKGIVTPPKVVDPQTGKKVPVPPHTHHPAQPNQNNPISKPAIPPHDQPHLPGYHPGNPPPNNGGGHNGGGNHPTPPPHNPTPPPYHPPGGGHSGGGGNHPTPPPHNPTPPPYHPPGGGHSGGGGNHPTPPPHNPTPPPYHPPGGGHSGGGGNHPTPPPYHPPGGGHSGGGSHPTPPPHNPGGGHSGGGGHGGHRLMGPNGMDDEAQLQEAV